jgi:hypothetical protein
MRDPSRQIESNVRHTLFAGWGQSLDEGIPSWMIDTVRYAMQLDQYLSLFPRESFLLITLEEFQEDPGAVLRRICRFLGVDENFEFARASERYNSGEAFEIPTWLAKVLTEGALVPWLVARTPRGLRYRVRALLPRLARRRAALGRHRLTDGERARLLEDIAPDLDRLERVYGVDVGRWWEVDSRMLGS